MFGENTIADDINQPWSSIQGVNPETFCFTVVGQWAGSTPVTCTVNWNAGVATITDEGQKKADATFNNCTDPNVEIDMKRYRIEPWFLWEITIQASGFNSAVWRTKNMYETMGWTTSNDATTWHFDGGAGHPISGAPSGTIDDCLRESSCISN